MNKAADRQDGPYLADAVANEFLELGKGSITPMKLQKLVYYAHAWNLAIFDVPLISDRIEAWTYGPVIPSLYDEFKEFRGSPITRKAWELDKQGKRIQARIPDEDERSKALIKKVWKLLGPLTPIQLSNMSHSTSEPWSKIECKGANLAIPQELIRDCFKQILHGQPSEK
jgi:uncharacterized phage-associated protein